MSHTCTTCYRPIYTPWDGLLATHDEIHRCASCDEHVCWHCREVDVRGEDYCQLCADDLEASEPVASAN